MNINVTITFAKKAKKVETDPKGQIFEGFKPLNSVEANTVKSTLEGLVSRRSGKLLNISTTKRGKEFIFSIPEKFATSFKQAVERQQADPLAKTKNANITTYWPAIIPPQ